MRTRKRREVCFQDIQNLDSERQIKDACFLMRYIKMWFTVKVTTQFMLV